MLHGQRKRADTSSDKPGNLANPATDRDTADTVPGAQITIVLGPAAVRELPLSKQNNGLGCIIIVPPLQIHR